MKIWKGSLLIIGISVILLSSMTAVAETESDAKDDVWHYVFPYYQSQAVSQPNSDIKELKAEISGDQITLSMTLWPGGEFSRGQYGHASYMMYYNTSDAFYQLMYGDLTGEEAGGFAIGSSLDASYTPPSSFGEVVVDGNAIYATMDKVGTDTTTTELYGLAWIWEGYGADQQNLDHWHDWAGAYEENLGFDPGNEGGNNNNNAPPLSGTPGFETLVVIAALGIVFIILRRKK